MRNETSYVKKKKLFMLYKDMHTRAQVKIRRMRVMSN